MLYFSVFCLCLGSYSVLAEQVTTTVATLLPPQSAVQFSSRNWKFRLVKALGITLYIELYTRCVSNYGVISRTKPDRGRHFAFGKAKSRAKKIKHLTYG